MAMNYKTRQLRDTRLSKMIVFIFILTCLPNSARATISILSELSNSTIATIEDSPARFIPDRFSFYKIEVRAFTELSHVISNIELKAV